MQFNWSDDKNRKLKQERGISFEEIIISIADGNVLNIVKHPNQERYPNQSIYVVNINEYAYLVPFVDDEHGRFLKTIIPSRKAAREYLSEIPK